MSHIHFIGIGGVGMSGLAQIAAARGDLVSGSDPQSNAATERLTEMGATIYRAQLAENIGREQPDLYDELVPVAARHAPGRAGV